MLYNTDYEMCTVRALANIMVPAPMVNIDNVLATKQYYSQKLIFHTLI